MGGFGAVAGLLLPKCPLCWMALTGSFVGASRMKWGFEAGGIAMFVFALWRLLRARRASHAGMFVTLTVAAAVLACGAWAVSSLAIRLTLWFMVLVGAAWVSQFLSNSQNISAREVDRPRRSAAMSPALTEGSNEATRVKRPGPFLLKCSCLPAGAETGRSGTDT